MIPDDINTYCVIDQYEFYYNHYKEKYGKVAVLYQSGAHFNVFGTDEIGNIKHICKDANIVMSFTNKDKGRKNTKSNPAMAGFPINSRSKYVGVLLKYGYTVVIIEQDRDKKKCDDSGLVMREVTGVFTPGTYPDELEDDVYIVYVYIEGFKDKDHNPMTVGLTSIDINTGDVDYYEVYNNPDDEGYAVDEIYRYISAHQPKEVLVTKVNIDIEFTFDYNVRSEKELKTENARIKFLEKMFPNRGIVDVLDYLDLEILMYARTSLSLLLHYVYEHNKSLLDNLKKPSIWFSDKYLLLANNAIEQLDVVNNRTQKMDSIFNLVNHTSTIMGKRLLKMRLTNPLRNPKEIEKRYDMVEKFSEWKKFRDILQEIPDLSQKHRDLEKGTISPLSLSFVINAYKKFVMLMDMCPEGYIKNDKFIRTYIKLTVNAFNLEECANYKNLDDVKTNIFSKGYSKKLDSLENNIQKFHEKLNAIAKELSDEIKGRYKYTVEILRDEELGYCMKMTNAKFELFSKNHDLVVLNSRMKSYKLVVTKPFEKISHLLIDTENLLLEKTKNLYIKFINYMESEHRSTYRSICKYVAEIDVYQSSGRVAEKYNYKRPTITENDYISVTNMRHPLIEQSSDNIFVPHTFSLGKKDQGMLIYGFNASGKSALMKALGANVIMAQAGMFVPAEKFRYKPYDNVLTRILSNDNIRKGQSSFAVEMYELNGIISRATDRSLVLGDEVCNTTETTSALSIVATTLEYLINKGTHFIFASHLHELVNLDTVKKLKNLGIYHIRVDVDGRKLVYRRTLEEGPGDSLYGIEVARAMGLPDEFIKKANDVRRKIINDEALGRQSRYNAKMYLDKCAVCGEKAVDTHHINEQRKADSRGFIDHFHKNKLRNMVGLCKKCHKMEQRGDIVIHGYDETSEGFVLNYEINENKT